MSKKFQIKPSKKVAFVVSNQKFKKDYSNYLPQYRKGGFFAKLGSAVGMGFTGLADQSLSALGLDNVIGEADYQWAINKNLDEETKERINQGVIPQINKMAGKIGNLQGTIGSALIPGGGAIRSGISGLNPTDNLANPQLEIPQQQQITVPGIPNVSTISPNRKYSYAPTFALGGSLHTYNGDTHQYGGIPIDNMGNPSAVTGNNPTGEVEKGEVKWRDYIFSDQIIYEE